MLLNLVGSSNADNKEILWKFINKFHKEIKPSEYPILDGLTEASDEDWIIISDLDEIPNPSILENIKTNHILADDATFKLLSQ